MIKAEYPNTFTDLGQVNSYLHQLTEKINLNFANTTAEAIWSDTAKALSVLSDKEASAKEKADILASYSAMRSLIIKTADYTVENSEKIRLSMAGEYVAKSDFGEYFEKATVDIEGTPVGITQLYGYTSGITGEFGDITVDSHNFIKTGLLYYDDNSLPVYGVGVGELATKVDANGHTVLDRSNLLATYTADEIAFWQNSNKVAYINNGALYMPAANITGGTLNINNKFTVDLLGNMKAENADITGKVKCTSLDCTNATVTGLTVGDNVTMGDNAYISWGNVSGKPTNLATTDDIPSAGTITYITQNAIETGDLRLGGSIYHIEGNSWWNNSSYLMFGVNSYGNLQIGTPVEFNNGAYEDINIYAPEDIFLVPGGVSVTSWEGWTCAIRGDGSPSGYPRGLYVSGVCRVNGSSVMTLSDMANYATQSDIAAFYRGGDSPTFSKIYLTSPGTGSNSADLYLGPTYKEIRQSTGSSRRFKNSITTQICEELNPAHLYDIDVVQFKYNTDYLSDENDYRYDRECIGFIAEDVYEKYPIAVKMSGEQVQNWDSYWLVPAMLKLIQEQKKDIDGLLERVNTLENGGGESENV